MSRASNTEHNISKKKDYLKYLPNSVFKVFSKLNPIQFSAFIQVRNFQD